jgi:hypothetical protein
VKVWCGVSTVGIIGPNSKNECGQAVTGTAECYKYMLETFLTPCLEMLQGHEHMWFQQDGATVPTVRISMAVLHGLFPQRLISHYGDVPWPPHSPDLSVPDFFL